MIGASVLVLASTLHMAPRSLDTTASAEPGEIHFQAALEVGAQALPSGVPGGLMDGFGVVSPRLGVQGGDEFEFELGADLRLRFFDLAPLAERDFGGRLRREDWDETSDFGQVLHNLRIGQEDGRLTLRGGRFTSYSLGAGWLVNRYDNRLSPDYHPAGGNLTAYVGPARLELFASDVLALRLFAAEARLDIGRLTTDSEQHFDRYYLTVNAAHDFGEAGGTTSAMSAANLGVHVGVVKGERLQAWAQGAVGARADTLAESIPDYGVALGVVVAGQPEETLAVTGRLEGRRQGGTFRFGLFGAGHELARFSGAGLSETPIAEELLPAGFSGYGEVSVAVSPDGPEGLVMEASASGEYFVATGRLDADVALQAGFPGGKARAELRAILTGLMGDPRYQVRAGMSYRFLPALYVLAHGGTVHFPQADGRLHHGFTAGLGIGVDFQR